MKRTLALLISLHFVVACSPEKSPPPATDKTKAATTTLITPDYELLRPTDEPAAALLILFGGYPERAADIKREFKIAEPATAQQVAVLFMNYSQRLWLEESEKKELGSRLQSAILKHGLPTDNIYVGGFSSGGNVALLLSDFLVGRDEFGFKPKGVFVVDSPVDLAELYATAALNVARNFSPPSVREGEFLLEKMSKEIGDPTRSLDRYETYSPVTFGTNNTDRIANLREIKIRLYTEPDTVWWQKHRQQAYVETNGYRLKRLYGKMRELGFEKVTYVTSENRGYRSGGERHPHSWSIVDPEELVSWMLAN